MASLFSTKLIFMHSKFYWNLNYTQNTCAKKNMVIRESAKKNSTLCSRNYSFLLFEKIVHKKHKICDKKSSFPRNNSFFYSVRYQSSERKKGAAKDGKW